MSFGLYLSEYCGLQYCRTTPFGRVAKCNGKFNKSLHNFVELFDIFNISLRSCGNFNSEAHTLLFKDLKNINLPALVQVWQ